MGELRCTLKQVQEGVAVPLDEMTRIIVVPAVAQVTVRGRSFDAGRTFLLPRACNALKEVFTFAMCMQAKHSVVVAHVDEAEPAPDALSEARAKLAAAWLSGDPAPWVDQYKDEVAEERRWGGREDRYLLSLALGNRSFSPSTAGETGDPRVRSFQELAGIKVDGIVGPVTRTKLVDKYFALSRTAVLSGAPRPERESDNGITMLDTQVTPLGAACNFSLQHVVDAKSSAEAGSESNAGSESGVGADASAEPESESNARLDFMFFFSDSGPEPTPAQPSGPEFLEWVKQTELQRAFRVTASSDGTRLWLELRDKNDTSCHQGAKYTLSGPETFTGHTDSQGRIDLDDVPAGDYMLRLTLEFFAGEDKIADEYTCPVLAQSAPTSPQVRLLGAVPRCEMAQLKGLLFETNKAFLVPEAIAALKDVRQLYERHNGSELLVVGHTDTTGTPQVNDPLSFERAKATLAYLQDEVDTWLTFYSTAMPVERRWGEAEDARMRELVHDSSLDRAGLIGAYMALDGVELDAEEFQIKALAHGCGENFPLDDSGEALDAAPADGQADVLDRRVELFFFDPEFGVVPKPKGDVSKPGSTQYPAWRKLAKVASEVDVAGPGDTILHYTLMSNSGTVALAGREYQLFVGDGCRRGMTDDAGTFIQASLAAGDYRMTIDDVETVLPTLPEGTEAIVRVVRDFFLVRDTESA